jgi:hypothetical protein
MGVIPLPNPAQSMRLRTVSALLALLALASCETPVESSPITGVRDRSATLLVTRTLVQRPEGDSASYGASATFDVNSLGRYGIPVDDVRLNGHALVEHLGDHVVYAYRNTLPAGGRSFEGTMQRFDVRGVGSGFGVDFADSIGGPVCARFTAPSPEATIDRNDDLVVRWTEEGSGADTVEIMLDILSVHGHDRYTWRTIDDGEFTIRSTTLLEAAQHAASLTIVRHVDASGSLGEHGGYDMRAVAETVMPVSLR